MSDENFEKWLDSCMMVESSDETWREFILKNFNEDTLYIAHESFEAGFNAGKVMGKKELFRVFQEVKLNDI